MKKERKNTCCCFENTVSTLKNLDKYRGCLSYCLALKYTVISRSKTLPIMSSMRYAKLILALIKSLDHQHQQEDQINYG